MTNKKRIFILGSTGNLGKQILAVIKKLPHFRVVGLTCNVNQPEILKQAKRFKPDFLVVVDKNSEKIPHYRFYYGEKGIIKAVKKEKYDIIFNALQGTVGILPTLAAIKRKKTVLMANKESLVAAGAMIMKEAKKCDAKIIPVDSEHSAIFQCLQGENLKEVAKVILSCSGGYTKKQNPILKDLLKNSRWQMGKKITVDSATLMNKGLEVIEAQILFNLPPEKIEVVIHPQSIIHSLVEFKDGHLKAILGPRDMRFPILYALNYPLRKLILKEKLSLNKLNLTFKTPNFQKFPCLFYAYQAAKTGGTTPAALVAADEIAVEYYLKKKIKFSAIPKIIKKIMAGHKNLKSPTLTNILTTIEKTKQKTRKLIKYHRDNQSSF